MAKLELSENFHRLKRTSLIFSTAVLITFLRGVAVTESGGLIGVSFKDVDINLVRLSLLIAAAYYFAGFFLEFKAHEEINAKALKSPEYVRFETYIDQIGAWAQNLVESDSSSVGQKKLEAINNLPAGLELAYTGENTETLIRDGLQESIRQYVGGFVESEYLAHARHLENDSIVEGVMSHLPPFIFERGHRVEDVIAAIKHYRSATQSLCDELNSLSQQLERLPNYTSELKERARRVHREVSRNTVAYFSYWEFWGAAIPFGLALALWIDSVTLNLARGLGFT